MSDIHIDPRPRCERVVGVVPGMFAIEIHKQPIHARRRVACLPGAISKSKQGGLALVMHHQEMSYPTSIAFFSEFDSSRAGKILVLNGLNVLGHAFGEWRGLKDLVHCQSGHVTFSRRTLATAYRRV